MICFFFVSNLFHRYFAFFLRVARIPWSVRKLLFYVCWEQSIISHCFILNLYSVGWQYYSNEIYLPYNLFIWVKIIIYLMNADKNLSVFLSFLFTVTITFNIYVIRKRSIANSFFFSQILWHFVPFIFLRINKIKFLNWNINGFFCFIVKLLIIFRRGHSSSRRTI